MQGSDTVVGMGDVHETGALGDHDVAWLAWQGAPWGRIRYRVAAETIQRTISSMGVGALRVLDVGGADAADSVPLASAGHHVTVLDPSASLLGLAHSRAASAGVAERLQTAQGGLDDLFTLGLGEFDLVLCHNVMHYHPDSARSAEALATSVRHGGMVSVMCPNPASDVLATAIRLEDPAGALMLLDADSVPSVTFETNVRRVEANDIASLLTERGFDAIALYGLLVVTPYIANEERKLEPDFFEDLETLEVALCDREPYIMSARIWQLVARRN